MLFKAGRARPGKSSDAHQRVGLWKHVLTRVDIAVDGSWIDTDYDSVGNALGIGLLFWVKTCNLGAPLTVNGTADFICSL